MKLFTSRTHTCSDGAVAGGPVLWWESGHHTHHHTHRHTHHHNQRASQPYCLHHTFATQPHCLQGLGKVTRWGPLPGHTRTIAGRRLGTHSALPHRVWVAQTTGSPPLHRLHQEPADERGGECWKAGVEA